MSPRAPEKRWENRQAAPGAEHCPLFHDLHTIREVLEPLGSEEPADTSFRTRTEGPAAWKLKSWTLMPDQSPNW